MKFSIVICTLNRPIILEKCVDSILKQTFENYEIIIIDQSNDYNKLTEQKSDKIIYKHIKQKGLSNARNVAIKIASGNYFCLMDDDAEYENNVLEIANNILSKNDITILCGNIFDVKKSKSFLSGMNNNTNLTTYQNIFKTCASGAMIIKTDFLKKYNFDDSLGIGRHWGSGEETDIVLLALHEKRKVLFSPDIVVYHPYTEKRDIPVKKAYSYSLGYGALCKKHIVRYKAKIMYYHYFKALFKHHVALLLSIIKQDRQLYEYYIKSIKGKMQGYKEYSQ